MMEQEDQETVLKINRYFSLGGHVSSHNHLIANPPESGERTHSHVLIGENLNKSFKVAAAESNAEEKHEEDEEDALLLQKKLCKECGKKFESWKALFGHMKCHSQKTVKGFAGFPKRKKRSRRRAMMMTRYEVDNYSSTLTSANSDYDQEEVAMSLIMLSNNDNNPEVLGSQLKKQKPRGSEIPTNETKFQCSTCSKTFHSYQALGGHRASHKKNYNNDGFAPPSQAMSEKVESSKKMRADDDRHECPICFKIFGSGQALGGHKRSHFRAGATKTDVQQQPEMQKPETRDFLDLNFPAPVEEEEEEDRERQQIIGFQAWLMMGRNYSHEQIVGPTSF
ncbi:unnamed protein product [Cuscuta campestris]|uniref:C2H2-type domain-containing protein n=1 Tax=Cuscuta campestris TaxID=132261 RepID=A0A484LK87_9ASTE|nr:unnamed protein product [Cuscuta campestris]